MSLARVALILAVLVLAAALLWWLIANRVAPTDRVGSATAAPTVVPSTPTPAHSPTPVRHRLAGIAQGEIEFAAVEGPDGVSRLYRVGEEIQGLGRLTRVDRDSATIDGASGPIRLRVLPASTASVTATRRSTPTAQTTRVTPTPRPARPARTAFGSSP